MCYLASDLAAHHGQMEVARLFSDLEKQGPPRQKVLLSNGKTEKEFIMANSKDDWKLFKKEVGQTFNISQRFKICNRGDSVRSGNDLFSNH